MHKLTGRRYHVIPVENEKLIVVDNNFIKFYNNKVKGKAQKLTIDRLIELSYYSTSVQGITRKSYPNIEKKKLLPLK